MKATHVDSSLLVTKVTHVDSSLLGTKATYVDSSLLYTKVELYFPWDIDNSQILPYYPKRQLDIISPNLYLPQ